MDKKEIVATYAYWAIRLTNNPCPPNLELAVRILDIRLSSYNLLDEDLEDILNWTITDINPARNWDIPVNELVARMLRTIIFKENTDVV